MRYGAFALLELLVWGIASAALARPPIESQPTTTAATDLRDLVASLRVEAREWLDDPRVGSPPVHPRVQAIYPTVENLAALGATLREPVPNLPAIASTPQFPVSDAFRDHFEALHIRYNLLVPLRYASPKDLRGMLPTLTQVEATAAYLDLPDFRGQDEAPLPPTADSQEPRTISASQANLRVSLYNTLVRYVRAHVTLLRLLAGDEQADQSVLDAIQRDLADKSITYMDALKAIESAVTSMSPERAQFFYDSFRQAVGRLGGRRTEYSDRTNLAEGDTTRFASQPRSAGTDIAAAVNILATRAHQPAINVPSEPRPGRPPRDRQGPP